MAEALLDKVLGKLAKDDEPAYEILEKYKGTDLERREYEPLLHVQERLQQNSAKKLIS